MSEGWNTIESDAVSISNGSQLMRKLLTSFNIIISSRVSLQN